MNYMIKKQNKYIRKTHPHIIDLGDNHYTCYKLEDNCLFDEDNRPYVVAKGFQYGIRHCSSFYLEVDEIVVGEFIYGLD